MSNIEGARGKIIAAQVAIKRNAGPYNATALRLLDEALAQMNREYHKRGVRQGNVVTEAHRETIRCMCRTGEVDNMTAADIAEQVIGHASASGRVSEIIAAYRKDQPYAQSAA